MMGIIDYVQKADRLRTRLLSDSKISDTNKDLLLRFLKTYDVSEARRSIFLERIIPLLRHTQDVKAEIHNHQLIAELFSTLRNRYSVATYGIYLGVSKRFGAWLNDGILPAALDQIKSPSRMKAKRKLDPSDMWSWADAEKAVRTFHSVQIKAIFLTQVDAGFRPSELLNLKFGDIDIRDKLGIARVRDGKTGPRNVVLYRCVEMLTQWIQAHPTQRKEDPLWVLEHADKSHKKESTKTNQAGGIKSYTYSAVCKRFRQIRDRSGVNKPVDLYALRHSSCVLDKKDNLPLDNAAERHGHSVKFFVEVYGRLSVEDTLDRFRLHYGIGQKSPIPAAPESPAVQQAISTHPNQSSSNPQLGTGNIELSEQLRALRDQILETAKREIEAKLLAQVAC